MNNLQKEIEATLTRVSQRLGDPDNSLISFSYDKDGWRLAVDAKHKGMPEKGDRPFFGSKGDTLDKAVSNVLIDIERWKQRGKPDDALAIPPSKDEKTVVLNMIHGSVTKLDQLLPVLKESMSFGLQKGKLAIIPSLLDTLDDLSEALEEYNSEDFTLDDLQDYR